jgi:hypothetical protein
MKNEYKKTAAGEYVITGFKIDSPRASGPKVDAEDEPAPEAEKSKEPEEPAKEEKQKGKKKKSMKHRMIIIEQEVLTKEQKKQKEKQELEELDKMLADMKRKTKSFNTSHSCCKTRR